MNPHEDTGEDEHQVVRSAATQLYAGAPADFVPTRTALVRSAKADGHQQAAKEIAALRRPSVAAWALNQVVHRGHPVMQQLPDLGARLRQATSALDAAAITGLREERDRVLADLVATAAAVSEEHGQRMSPAVEGEVRNCGIAALADEAAEAAVTSGTLTRALSYSGFGEVDLSEAAATTSTGVVLTSIRGGRSVADHAPRSDGTASDHGADGGAPAGGEGTTTGEEGTTAETTDGVSTPVDEPAEDGAAALAESAAAAERERRVTQAEEAVTAAELEIGRRRSAVEAARNRTDATRQRIQKLEDQLQRARAEDEEALGALTDAVSAAQQAATDLERAREHLASVADHEPDA